MATKLKTCKSPGCKKPSKGPRYHFLCEDHRDQPSTKKPKVKKEKTNSYTVSPHPLDEVVRMTDVERLNLAKVEAELMNHLLQIKNLDFEAEAAKRKFTAEVQARADQRSQLIALAEAKKNEQQQTVQDIADKYKLDPQQMTYDPDSGVLRDLRTVT